ncbi:response regulator [Flavobacterium sp. SUN046]|uniref:response regulator n=1 Tax=Flavobacterium sp. SUN046 TaxID=3002440 RepID=UPI002DBB59EB|nr:response regulator [Flavobacterium sp. SUN046]MEC4049473.1 response regulator [Flavobacterium sp. SUN046]
MLDKILCIDDDPITLMLCKKVLTKAEFSKEIDFFKNGEEAIQYFDNLKCEKTKELPINPPSLIFLDLNMPIMNGWEFLDLFSNKDYFMDFPNTKVIVLSSTIDPKDLNKSKSYPMVIEFLSKPITKEMLEIIKNTI